MHNLYGMERHTSALAPRGSETHGGSDVGIFSAGPWSHLFHTTHEQTHIANVMWYSACLGPYADEDRCKSGGGGDGGDGGDGGNDNGGNSATVGIWLVAISLALTFYQSTAL